MTQTTAPVVVTLDDHDAVVLGEILKLDNPAKPNPYLWVWTYDHMVDEFYAAKIPVKRITAVIPWAALTEKQAVVA